MVLRKPSRGASVTRPASVSLRRKGDRMHDEIELAPFGRDPLEHRLELALGHHVHRHEDRCLDLARQRLDMRLCLVVEIGDREIGAEGAKGSGTAPGDRVVIGDADDETLAAFEQLGFDMAGMASVPPWMFSD